MGGGVAVLVGFMTKIRCFTSLNSLVSKTQFKVESVKMSETFYSRGLCKEMHRERGALLQSWLSLLKDSKL